MNSDKEANIKIEKNISAKTNLISIKSDYFLQKMFDLIGRRRTLESIRYNKKIQNALKLNINDYIEFPKIKIEITIGAHFNNDDFFICPITIKNEERKYYHIYLDDNNEEYNGIRYEINGIVKRKVKLIIDREIKSLAYLFHKCEKIKSINFVQFSRSSITDMTNMFAECKRLEELDISNFNTENVTSMRCMFNQCESLKKLDLSKFKTEKVTDMNNMFSYCNSLTELDLSNFNTEKVTDMRGMFDSCTSLKKLNISNFNYNNVTGKNMMFGMLGKCPNNIVTQYHQDNRIKDEAYQSCAIF